jgi:hemolysin activation/secretion protein
MAQDQAVDEAAPVAAQRIAPVVPVKSEIPLIGAVSLAGANSLGYATLASAYEPFIGKAAEPSVLQDLARTLADAARERGYLFATAVVPDQTVTVGVVRVQIELGAIDQIRVIGSDNKRLRAVLETLVGLAPTASQIERQLLLAGDLPGITVLGSRYDRQDGRRILEVRVKDLARRVAVTVDNLGPRAYGPVRVRVNANFYDVGRAGSQLGIQATRALDKDELTYAALRYSTVVANGAGVIGVAASAGRSEPGSKLAFTLAGDSRYVAAFSSWNLARSRAGSAWANIELAYLGIEQAAAGKTFQRERAVTATVSLSGNHEVGKGRIAGEVGILKGMIPTSRIGEDLSYTRAGTAKDFTRANAWVSYSRPIGTKSAVRVMAQAQAAPRALPASYEVGLGGAGYGRAYDFNERFGDQGAMASVEVTHNLKLKGLQGFVFADAGKVTEYGPSRFGEGRLASAGAGLRLQTDRFEAEVFVAKPLNTDRFATGDRSPRVGATLSWKF